MIHNLLEDIENDKKGKELVPKRNSIDHLSLR